MALPSLLKKYYRKIDFDLDRLESTLSKIKSTDLEFFGASLKAQQDSQKDVLRKALEHFLVGNVAQHFSLIDSEIFNLKRWVKIKFHSTGATVDIDQLKPPTDEENVRSEKGLQVRWLRCNRLAHVRFSPNDPGDVAVLGETAWPGSKNKVAKVRAKLPVAIPSSIAAKRLECKSLHYRGVSEAYKLPLAASVLESNTSRYVGSSNWGGSPNPSFRIVWEPRKKDLYVSNEVIPPADDPALIMVFLDRSFLIDTWDAVEEKNIDHILKEFSI